MDAITVTVPLSMDAAEERVRAALGEQGFGVLTEIDVAATLKAKLGVERAPLKILGACNPTLANRALELEPKVGLLLPCNVTLEATADGTEVAAVDPIGLLGEDALCEVAEEARTRLQAALDALAAG